MRAAQLISTLILALAMIVSAFLLSLSLGLEEKLNLPAFKFRSEYEKFLVCRDALGKKFPDYSFESGEPCFSKFSKTTNAVLDTQMRGYGLNYNANRKAVVINFMTLEAAVRVDRISVTYTKGDNRKELNYECPVHDVVTPFSASHKRTLCIPEKPSNEDFTGWKADWKVTQAELIALTDWDYLSQHWK